MMDMGEWFWLAVILAVVVVVGIPVRMYLEKKRREALAQVALRTGFSFQDKDPGLGKEEFTQCSLFNRGWRRKFKNIFKGSGKATQELLFDYQYTISSGRRSHTYSQTVAVFQLDKTTLPDFRLEPESILNRTILSKDLDIDFGHAPTFSKNYFLRGADEQAVRALFSPDVLQFFETRRGWSVEGKGKWLVVHRNSRRAKPDQFQQFLNDVRDVPAKFEGR